MNGTLTTETDLKVKTLKKGLSKALIQREEGKSSVSNIWELI